MPHVNDAPNAQDLERQASLLSAMEANKLEANRVEEDRVDLIAAGREYGLSWHQIAQALGYKTGRYVAEKYRSKI